MEPSGEIVQTDFEQPGELNTACKPTVRKACLGYFQNDQNADDASVLVVSYKFENDKEMRRDGNEVDLVNLRKTFQEKRKCRYQELASPTVAELIGFLSDKDKSFQISAISSVFILIILSHGENNNKILTDHIKDQVPGNYETFLTTDVVKAIQKCQNTTQRLNVIFFGPCRGTLKDVSHKISVKPEEYGNEMSSRVTNMPGAEDFVLVYSTVESTKSNRSGSCGTWMVEEMCKLLNNLIKNESLENFLTKLQNQIHQKLCDLDGQTPEIKYTRHRQFILWNASLENKEDSRVGKGGTVVTAERSAFFRWQTQDGKNDTDIRAKWAVIFSNKESNEVQRMENALRKNLGFETNILGNITENLDYVYDKTQGEQSYVGCFLAVFYAPLDLENNEVIVRLNTNVKIGDIVYKFFGPGNKMWIARPKIFFFVHEDIQSDGFATASDIGKKLEIPGTNHSGSLVCILKAPASAEKLVKTFENPGLRDGSFNILELTLDLVRNDDRDLKNQVLPQISSTLHCFLDFPRWLTCFVELSFNISKKICTAKESESGSSVDEGLFLDNRRIKSVLEKFGSDIRFDSVEQENKQITYKKLLEEMKLNFLFSQNENDYALWIFSSLPGSGKSTAFQELTCFFTQDQNCKKFVYIPLLEHHEIFLNHQECTVEEFLKQSSGFTLNVEKLIESNQLVVLLDGFDEICPLLRDKVINLILKIVERKIHLLVATRPQEEGVILKILENVTTFKVEICPLSEIDQRGLVQKLESLTSEKSKQLIQKISECGASEILTNPLHLSLIVKSGKEISNLYLLYDEVIEKQIEDAFLPQAASISEKFEYRNKRAFIDELLKEFAHQALLSDGNRKWTNEEINCINKIGIASAKESYSRFVHQTFAEFLVTKKFVQELDANSSIPIFTNKIFRQCRIFYDWYLLNEDPKHSKFKNYLQRVQIKKILRTIVRDGLWNTFQLTATFITFDNLEISQDKHFVSEGFKFLKIACKSNERIAIRLLEMEAYKDSIANNRLEKLSELVENLATKNYFKLFSKLKQTFSDLQEVLRHSYKTKALLNATENNSMDVFELLLNSGIDINIQDENGDTALHIASRKGQYDCILKLLDKKASIVLTNNEGRTPLHEAAKNGHAVIVTKLLGSGAIHRSKCNLGWTPLHFAALLGNFETLKLLVDLDQTVVKDLTKANNTAFHLAAHNEDLQLCEYLFKNGVDLLAVDEKNLNALHYASAFGSLQTVQWLLRLNIYDINSVDKYGKTSLHLAAEKKQTSTVEWLVNRGADFRLKDNWGWTPLHFAAHYGNYETLKFLVDLDPTAVRDLTKANNTAVHFATYNEDSRICKYLIEKGADPLADDDNKINALHHASAIGNLRNVQFLLSLDCYDINGRDKNGKTALHLAAEKRQTSIVEFLIKEGADHRSKDNLGLTPLLYAAQYGNLETLKVLVHFDPDIGSHLTVHKCTALHLAVLNDDVRLIEYLVKNGVNPLAVEYNNCNALHNASAFGSLQSVQSLLKLNCYDINEKNKYGKTALHLAAEKKQTSIVMKLVKEGADHRSKNNLGWTPLHYAARHGNFETLKYLVDIDSEIINDVTSEKCSALHLAIYNEDARLCKYLVEKGINKYAADENKFNALHYASALGSLQIILFLLSQKCYDISAREKHGKTALHLAAEKKHTTIVEFLIKEGADHRAKDNNGSTPLHYAAEHGNFETLKFLVDYDPDVLRDSTNLNNTALHFAACNEDVRLCKYLIEKGCKPLAFNDDNWNALHYASACGSLLTIQFLSNLDCYDINEKIKNGRTALHLAAEKKKTSIVEFLVNAGADIRSKDNFGSTPLHYAAQYGNLETLKVLVNFDPDVLSDMTIHKCTALHLAVRNHDMRLCDYLVKSGVAPLTVDKDHWNALHWASAFGGLQTIQYLLGLKCYDINSRDVNGRTALHLAIEKKQSSIVEWLVKENADYRSKNNSGWTPIHYAARIGNYEILKFLVDLDINILKDLTNKNCTALHLAAQFASAEICKLLVEAGADLTLINDEGHDALSYACVGEKAENVEYFLSLRKFDLERKLKSLSASTLFIPVIKGNVEIVKILLKAGANVNARSDHQSTPLLIAAELSTVEMCQMLVETGADLSAEDNDGDGVLHCACLHGDLDIVQYFVQLIDDKRPDAVTLNFEKPNKEGKTALQYA